MMVSVLKKLKQSYLNARILLSCGQLNPEWVSLPPHGHLVHIDPHDERARKIILADTIRGKYRQNRDFWERACRILSPDWALEVGVNFGECLFVPRYAPHTKVIGIEANPELERHLRASKSQHPQGQQIDLRFGVAAEASGKDVQFFIDDFWSGGSTAALTSGTVDTARHRIVKSCTLCVDELILQGSSNCNLSLVFKVDVEGYESHVMAGMAQTLSNCQSALGFVEFDPDLLARAGVDAEKFFLDLQRQFEVWMFTSPREIVPAKNIIFAKLKQQFGFKHLHTDLVLRHGLADSLFQEIVSPWLRPSHAAA